MNPDLQRIEVVVAKLVAARPEDVFDLWLDAKSPGSPWFGPQRVLLHPEVDGLFFHAVEHAGRSWAHYGRFTRLERPALLEHTWMSEATRGIESVVTLTLEPRGDATLVTLRHSNLPDDAMGRQHEDGWGYVLGAIAERFSPGQGAAAAR